MPEREAFTPNPTGAEAMPPPESADARQRTEERYRQRHEELQAWKEQEVAQLRARLDATGFAANPMDYPEEEYFRSEAALQAAQARDQEYVPVPDAPAHRIVYGPGVALAKEYWKKFWEIEHEHEEALRSLG